MHDDILAEAQEQAERSDPPVRAAALLRIARVQLATDPAASRATFGLALDATRELAGRDREYLLEQALLIAAAVAPDLMSGILEVGNIARSISEERLVTTMLEHGHVQEAVSFMQERGAHSEFPFATVPQVLKRVSDQKIKLAVLHGAIAAWSATPYNPHAPHDDDFIRVFQSYWKLLPESEALAVAREIVRVTLEQPEKPMTATYGEGDMAFTSGRAHTLFQILSVLRHLDAPLAELLISKHRELARAALRFPNGLDSWQQEMDARRQSLPPNKGGYFMAGATEDFPYGKSLMQASQDGDFLPPIQYALEKYARDSAVGDPNLAPREFWPSTCTFRSILYRAGKRFGKYAGEYLHHIPDIDLRLLAQIELAAVLAGLPELRSTQREYRANPRPS